MEATAVIREAWDLYKAQWRHFLPIAFVVYVLLSLFALLLTALLGWLGALAGAFVSVAGIFWLQGALVVAIEDVRDGRPDLSIPATLSRVRPRLNTLAVAGILAAIAISIGLVLLVVPGLVLFTLWFAIVPVIVLEGAGIGESFGRSMELVRGSFWSVFGLVLLTFVILLGLFILLALVLAPLPDSIQAYAGNIVRNTLAAPFLALALTLGYYRLRGRSEPAPAAAVY